MKARVLAALIERQGNIMGERPAWMLVIGLVGVFGTMSAGGTEWGIDAPCYASLSEVPLAQSGDDPPCCLDASAVALRLEDLRRVQHRLQSYQSSSNGLGPSVAAQDVDTPGKIGHELRTRETPGRLAAIEAGKS